ncbi:helicase-related protein [Oceanobacillus timonensis]|uniref:helicase-related protein n=1 Tax=Oceanobacillus timonensis TaxID=1926285 RepID=UPI003CCC30E4
MHSAYEKEEYQRLQQHYRFNESFQEWIIDKANRLFILKRGVDEYIHEKLIPAAYQKAFENGIPDHLKEEYPETRLTKRHFIIHAGPTNSGKTYQSIQSLLIAKKGIYLAPLRLLALEVFEKLNDNGVSCDLITGEKEIIVPFSTHLSSTVEKANFQEEYPVAVIDEAQLISDKERGSAWFRAIIGIKAKEIHICCSLNAVKLIKRIVEDCNDKVEIHYHERNTPLIVQKEEVSFPADIKKGDAIIAFSRKKVLRMAAHLRKNGFKPAIIYGALPPITRRKQVEFFNNGKADVVVATDAIGMGINLPIQRIIFSELEKFDGTGIRKLTSQEIKQIAGRSGRRGIYNIGWVASMTKKSSFIENKLNQKDSIIKKAVIEPLEETILQIQYGNLINKLRYWNDFTYKLNYLEKADISKQLDLLMILPKKILESNKDKLLYHAVHIPFQKRNTILTQQWQNYVFQVCENNQRLEKPFEEIFEKHSLDVLEVKYKQLDLYYSFSKVFQKQLDREWVTKHRQKVSNLIMQYLIGADLKIFISCRGCGENRLYFEAGDYCEKCSMEHFKREEYWLL